MRVREADLKQASVMWGREGRRDTGEKLISVRELVGRSEKIEIEAGHGLHATHYFKLRRVTVPDVSRRPENHKFSRHDRGNPI